jgi:queuine/archaeosine tRNA-ribosyltransferase
MLARRVIPLRSRIWTVSESWGHRASRTSLNVTYCQRLMHDIRDAISRGIFESFRERTRAEWAKGDIAPR